MAKKLVFLLTNAKTERSWVNTPKEKKYSIRFVTQVALAYKHYSMVQH